MAMRAFFERDIYIRLSEDGTHFTSTTTLGRFFRRTAEFDVNDAAARETVDEKSLAPLRKRLSYPATGDQ
jgi:hypothetical protein